MNNKDLQHDAKPEISVSSPWREFSEAYPIGLLQAVIWMIAFYGAQAGAKWLVDEGHLAVPDWFPSNGLQNLVMIVGTTTLLVYWKLLRKAKLQSLGLSLERLGGDLRFAAIAALGMAAFYLLAAIVYWAALHGVEALLSNVASMHMLGFRFDGGEAFKSHLRGAVFKEHSLLFYFAVVLCMPIVEEIWFRGLLYTPMRDQMGRVPAILLLSLIFATAHNNAFPINQFFGGLIFVWAYEMRRTLVAPIILHILGNGSLVVLGWAFEKWQLV